MTLQCTFWLSGVKWSGTVCFHINSREKGMRLIATSNPFSGGKRRLWQESGPARCLVWDQHEDTFFRGLSRALVSPPMPTPRLLSSRNSPKFLTYQLAVSWLQTPWLEGTARIEVRGGHTLACEKVGGQCLVGGSVQTRKLTASRVRKQEAQL